MTKLKLNLAHEAGEILTKEEMKNVLGGNMKTVGCSIKLPCKNIQGELNGLSVECSATGSGALCTFVSETTSDGITYTYGVKCSSFEGVTTTYCARD